MGGMHAASEAGGAPADAVAVYGLERPVTADLSFRTPERGGPWRLVGVISFYPSFRWFAEWEDDDGFKVWNEASRSVGAVAPVASSDQASQA